MKPLVLPTPTHGQDHAPACARATCMILPIITAVTLSACAHRPIDPHPVPSAPVAGHGDHATGYGDHVPPRDADAPDAVTATGGADGLSATGVLTSPVRRYLPLLPRRRAPRLELVAQLGGKAQGLAGAGDRLHYLRGGRVVTLDAAAPDEPLEVAQSEALSHAATRLRSVADGALLLAYGERAVMLLDGNGSGAEADGPTLLSTLTLPDRVTASAEDARAQRLWLAASEHGLLALDIADPAAPRIIGRLPARGDTVDVTLRGDMAYVVDRKAGLLVVDIADPTAPRELGRFDDDGDARSVLLVGEHLAYVSTTHRFWVVDIRDPQRPRKVWQPKELDGPQGPLEVAHGGLLSRVEERVLLHGHQLNVIDVREPERPQRIRTYKVPVRDELGGLGLVEGHLWVGGREAGLLGYHVSR